VTRQDWRQMVVWATLLAKQLSSWLSAGMKQRQSHRFRFAQLPSIPGSPSAVGRLGGGAGPPLRREFEHGRGDTSDPRIDYEVDAFPGAARRAYEAVRRRRRLAGEDVGVRVTAGQLCRGVLVSRGQRGDRDLVAVVEFGQQSRRAWGSAHNCPSRWFRRRWEVVVERLLGVWGWRRR